jgi:16S rRNA (guanine527-N7)-methyltransferase
MVSSPEKLREALAAGIAAMGLDIDDATQERLVTYLQQLHKWNQAFNLSGIKNIDEMLSLHLLDSLVMVPFMDGKRIADVGTGAGLPGFPLALCFPEKEFILVDSNSKKTRFIFQTAALLNVKNITVVSSRVEDYASQPQVDIVTSRAFASLTDFVESCRHLVSPTGKFLAMKGLYPDAEVAALPPGYRVTAVHALTVPGLAAERHVLEIRLDSLPETGRASKTQS